MQISKYELIPDKNSFTLVIYLEDQIEEFSDELGNIPKVTKNLQTQVQHLVKEKFPNISINSAKVIVGTLLLTTIYLIPATFASAENTSSNSIHQSSQADVYKVQAGDTLTSISRHFAISVKSIKAENGLISDNIFVGQVLTLPFTTYTVGTGDTLYNISKKFNTTVDKISSFNQLPNNTIFIGQKIKIPSHSITDKIVPSPPITGELISNSSTYSVVAGDTLYSIAKTLNTTVDKIITANNLTSTTISIGQLLNIPTEKKETVKDLIAPIKPQYNPLEAISMKNQSAFSISGSAEPNSTVHIVVSDGDHPDIIKQTSVNDRGEFTATLNISTFNDGNIAVLAKAVDSSGNESVVNETRLYKDTVTTEPIIDNKQLVTIENATNYTIFGLTEPGATVEITLSDGMNPPITTSGIANETGEFRANVDLRTLNDGAITITTRAIDSLGNNSPINRTTITKETSLAPPVIENTRIINSQTADTYMVHGRARPNSTVNITVSDEENQDVTTTTKADTNGEFHVEIDLSSLNDTDLTITASQSSASGIKSQAETMVVRKDTSAPSSPVLNNNNFINSQNQRSYLVTGTGEPGALLKVRVSDGNDQVIEESVRVNENGMYSITLDLSVINDGDIKFQLSQIDEAGNISPVTNKTLVKDTIGPTNFNFDLLPTIYSGNISNYILNGTAEPQITFEINVTDGTTSINKSGTTDSNGNFTIPIDMSTLKDGDLAVSLNATDSAGNTSKHQPINLVKDTVVSDAEITTIAPYVNNQNKSNFSIMGTSVEEGAYVKIVISDGTTNISKTSKVVDGRFSTNLDLAGLKDGRLTFELTQTDKVGNESLVNASTIEKDTLVENPILAKSGFNFENQRHSYTVIGTAEPNATITISLLNSNNDRSLTKSSYADSKGFYSMSVYLEEEDIDGDITASVSQIDVAGNSSGATTTGLYSHSVTSGETLNTIAKRYNTTVDAIKTLNNLSSDNIQPNQTIRLPITASEVLNLGYMYFGNTKDYINTVNSTANSVNTVSPSYFDINSDGSLKLTYSLDTHFIETMHQQGIRVVPFLSNHWNREAGRAFLKDKERAAQQIADAVARYNLDGVNVDIENVTDVDRENYTEFVRLLREKIPLTKEVSVAVAANPNNWTQGWHGSYDYTRLAKYADYLMIMSYDESFPGGEAGPVASVPWVEKSIQYAINQHVPTEKIVIGIAHYGRYWIEGSSYGGFGISNWQIQDLIKKHNGTVVFDENSKSPKAIITIKEGDPKTIISGTTLIPGTYTIWYENEESIRHKLSLVSQYNIRGVGNWSIGQEDKEVWNSYATTLPTTVPITSPINPIQPDKPVLQTLSTYTVVAGDTLWAIANQNQTTVNQLREQNNLSTDSLSIGQSLLIPTTSGNKGIEELSSTPIQEVSTITYKVVSGDSLSAIARRYKTSVTAIKEENELKTDVLSIGQELSITTTIPIESNEIEKLHTVVPGDSLYGIARLYETTVTAIRIENDLSSDSIYVGQALKIPSS